MKIRPGRTRSLVAGVAALLVTVVGVVMLRGFAGLGGTPAVFLVLWVVMGLGGAAAAFYNAFSREGLPLYEVDFGREAPGEFCPNCGRPVSQDDRFCRHCGHALKE